MTTEEIMEKAGKVIAERSQIKEKELSENEILVKAIDEKLKELREQIKELTKAKRSLVNGKSIRLLNDVSKYYWSKIEAYRATVKWAGVSYEDEFEHIRKKAVLTATNGRTQLVSELFGNEIDKAKEIAYKLVDEWYPGWVARMDAYNKSLPAPKKK